jgi:hypothetical protein
MVLYKVTVFRSSRIFNMAARANNKLWLAEISKIFISETNELTEPKLWMNDHWNVLYQVSVFYADRKSKMAAIAGHRLTLDPMGKCSNAFFSDLRWRPSWISDRHKKQKLGKGHSNDHSFTVWVQSVH